jgi:hypothetical protein
MFGQNLNDNSDSESQPQTERTVSQPKVHLKWKKVASRPSPCKNQSETNFCRYLPFATIRAYYFSNVSIWTIKNAIFRIELRKVIRRMYVQYYYVMQTYHYIF